MVGFLVVVAIGYVLLPTIDEVPATFPASLLWNFRLSSLGTQVTLWTVLGLAFAALVGRCAPARAGWQPEAVARVNGVRLVAAAPTPALRRAEFGGDDDLDEGGMRAALALRKASPAASRGCARRRRAAQQTASGARRTSRPSSRPWPIRITAVDRPDDGAGRPGGAAAWLTDPRFAPHGGESLAAVRRAGRRLAGHAGRARRSRSPTRSSSGRR